MLKPGEVLRVKSTVSFYRGLLGVCQCFIGVGISGDDLANSVGARGSVARQLTRAQGRKTKPSGWLDAMPSVHGLHCQVVVAMT